LRQYIKLFPNKQHYWIKILHVNVKCKVLPEPLGP